jgi:hypothetical protein
MLRRPPYFLPDGCLNLGTTANSMTNIPPPPFAHSMVRCPHPVRVKLTADQGHSPSSPFPFLYLWVIDFGLICILDI